MASFQGLAKSLTEGLVSKGTVHCLCVFKWLGPRMAQMSL